MAPASTQARAGGVPPRAAAPSSLGDLRGERETTGVTESAPAGEWTAHVIDTAPLDTSTVDTVPDRIVGHVPVEHDSRAEEALGPYSEALLITCAFALRCNPLSPMNSEQAQKLLEITLPLGHARVLRWRSEVDPGQWQVRWRRAVALTREFYPNQTGAQRVPDELDEATEAGLLPAY
ncbi:hypothetical protein [Saccharothrix sp.]|uniref:hypothetical protein n=1 Tax=Saccharothrix sp. TaxID=1873460 RepID=UPI002811861E|nr:hypothetical protein [Saccharothrix sp.]